MNPESPNSNGEEKPGQEDASLPYPEFGKRHDIFYQYQPPAEQQITPPPSYIEPAADEAYPAQEPEEYEEPAAASGRFKRVFVIAAVVLTVAAIAGVFLLLRHGNKPVADNNSSSSGGSQPAQDPNLVVTPCFNFTLPTPHAQLSPSISSCAGSYFSGANSQAGVTIQLIITPFTSVSDMVATWKNNNPTYKIAQEGPATFGVYQAYQIQWTPADLTSETNRSVLVYTPPTNGVSRYTNDQGATVFGFEIDGRYDSQSSSKAVFDSILASWTWK